MKEIVNSHIFQTRGKKGILKNDSRRSTIIFCRSKKKAREVYEKWTKKKFNPNNGICSITEQGYLKIDPTFLRLDVRKFWDTCGFYPVLVHQMFFNKKLYNKWTPNSVKFIREIT